MQANIDSSEQVCHYYHQLDFVVVCHLVFVEMTDRTSGYVCGQDREAPRICIKVCFGRLELTRECQIDRIGGSLFLQDNECNRNIALRKFASTFRLWNMSDRGLQASKRRGGLSCDSKGRFLLNQSGKRVDEAVEQ